MVNPIRCVAISIAFLILRVHGVSERITLDQYAKDLIFSNPVGQESANVIRYEPCDGGAVELVFKGGPVWSEGCAYEVTPIPGTDTINVTVSNISTGLRCDSYAELRINPNTTVQVARIEATAEKSSGELHFSVNNTMGGEYFSGATVVDLDATWTYGEVPCGSGIGTYSAQGERLTWANLCNVGTVNLFNSGSVNMFAKYESFSSYPTIKIGQTWNRVSGVIQTPVTPMARYFYVEHTPEDVVFYPEDTYTMKVTNDTFRNIRIENGPHLPNKGDAIHLGPNATHTLDTATFPFKNGSVTSALTRLTAVSCALLFVLGLAS
eukprot:Selendium_serpulae@DN5675_c0_g1_i1.p1